MRLPVESVAHLDGDQHRQGHGHGRAGLKDLAVNANEVLVFVVALHEVGLHGGVGRLISVWLNLYWCRGAMLGGLSFLKRVAVAYQLVVADTGASWVVQEPPGSTTNGGGTNVSWQGKGEQRWCEEDNLSCVKAKNWKRTHSITLTTNGHVSEEQPAGDQGLLGGTWGLAHDVQVRWVEAQSGGRQTISHQVDPQQLDGDQSLGQTQGSGQEDTGDGGEKRKSSG